MHFKDAIILDVTLPATLSLAVFKYKIQSWQGIS